MDTITVGGPPGSGTSTLCLMLRSELGVEYVYAGQIFRDRARSMGLTLAEFGDLCEKDPSYDKQLDDSMVTLAKGGDILLEGRMIGPLCKVQGIRSFRVYIDADTRTRALRLMERDGGQIEDVVTQMEEREESEALRYLKIYNIDPRDSEYYDLIIDSTDLTPEEEMERIIMVLERTG